MLTLFVVLLAIASAMLLTLLFRMLSSVRERPAGETERPLFPHDPAIDGQPFEQAPA